MATPSRTPSRLQTLMSEEMVATLAQATRSVHAATAGTLTMDASSRTKAELTFFQVICSLAQLQSAVADLSRAYINHANTVLNRGHSDIDISTIANITSALHENGLIPGVPARAASPARSEVGEKKKRKRAPPDPNAPKRALTPFFLFMQHNRAKIAAELGSSAKPKAVSDEGTRRWADMPEAEKESWKNMYADNLAVYKEKMKAYKESKSATDDARAASQLQQDVETAEVTNGSDSSDEDSEEEESPEPVREPTPPRNTKRRRSEVKTPKQAETPKIPAPEAKTPSENKKASPEKKSPEKKASPEKKRRAARNTKDETPASARKAPEPAKRQKKKRKSEADAA